LNKFIQLNGIFGAQIPQNFQMLFGQNKFSHFGIGFAIYLWASAESGFK
jgi:hypothetical protein